MDNSCRAQEIAELRTFSNRCRIRDAMDGPGGCVARQEERGDLWVRSNQVRERLQRNKQTNGQRLRCHSCDGRLGRPRTCWHEG
jgi:hypothetical protein